VAVGALVDQKGIDVLVAAAGLSQSPWQITIVGSGERRAELERAAARVAPGRARFAGWADEPSAYMRAAHVLCMPSRYESFGYAAVEAAAHGRATVGSRIDGLDEIVVPGRTGILVEPGDPGALAAALDGLWDDFGRIAALGHGARERAQRHFTIARTVDALLAIYERQRARR
jgi:glycosyltransferase involved in cell wall biosynthesis